MRKYVIALYIRLSVEDIKTESLSIPNQRLILREKAMSLPEWDNGEVLEFVDNGHTGTNFERPAVQELLTMVQAGSIDCIIVKDLSRFGRNSIETGYFIERVFPLYHTRFISVSDDFDTVNFKGDTGGIDVAQMGHLMVDLVEELDRQVIAQLPGDGGQVDGGIGGAGDGGVHHDGVFKALHGDDVLGLDALGHQLHHLNAGIIGSLL